MKILAISTSSNICSIALLEDDKVIQELNTDDTRTHSENLMPLIEKILDSNSIQIFDINLIACDNGPGSFTGIRIGISTIKGLAAPHDISVIPISSLEGLAYNAKIDEGHICSLIDARNNQVYCGIFDKNYNLCTKYIADDINNVLPVLNNYNNIVYVGDGAQIHKELFLNRINNIQIHSKNIGLAAYTKYKQGIKYTIDSIKPEYLRQSQAERMRSNNG